ncbi:hypothetical protein H1W37_08540 [Stappia taiwanensis]|uniref:Uncharacterized protein n=1 Tax=Stappia taiwanensis TaxID=992267 RepID=A0A838XXC6_9HYPH|nr:hypothetical protein [Stappia taiwanensis]MBA4611694.1 hypothetical protein [Stappia taiwanensis]GGE97504.1 hypothetical protein GCM10007285_26440 [Stappia taiwanensis]
MSIDNSRKDDTVFEAGSGVRGLWRLPLFRMLAINWLIGAFVSVMVLGGLLWFDTGNLRSLILNSQEPLVPILVLLFGLMITLCSAAMGAAVMALPTAKDDDAGGSKRRQGSLRWLMPRQALVPARVAAGGRKPDGDR